MRAAFNWPLLLAVGVLLATACTQATPASTPTSATATTSPDVTPTPTPTPTPPRTDDDGTPTRTATETPPPTTIAPPPGGGGPEGEGPLFTSGPPGLLECLRNALDDQAFEEIAGNQRPPSEEEGPIIGGCTRLFGGLSGPDGPGGQVLWSSTQSVWMPDGSLFSVSFEPGEVLGRATVIGRAGAVSTVETEIMVVALELGLPATVVADGEGAFQAEIDAVAGGHILIVQADGGPSSSGLLLPIPPGVAAVGGSRIGGGGAGRPPYIVTGSLENRSLQPGQEVSLTGRVVLPFPLNEAPEDATLAILGILIGDAAGQQVGLGAEFVSSFLTPIGLPVERNFMSRTQDREIASGIPLSWDLTSGYWGTDFSETVTIPEAFAPGLYQLTAVLALEDFTDAAIESQVITTPSYCCEASLGNFTVGDPAPMRLATVILADVLDEGSRGGVRAIQDKNSFDISARVAARHNPVVPRVDGLGDSYTYRLEPYLPMFGVSDREPPMIPPILVDFTNSELTITVARPDGSTEELGPAPLTHYGFNVPSLRTACFMESGISTGGHLSGLIQLRDSTDAFAYEFPVDGDYTVSLDGHLADYDGRTYEISGDYEITVANSLKISPALLPGTPFEIGDNLAPALLITPAVPADVTYSVAHVAADGSTTRTAFTGRANRYGWWDAAGDLLEFSREGEYRIDIEARHEASGALWVGRMRFGSVVASEDPPIILHGRRGAEGGIFGDIPPPSPWFFRRTFDPLEGGHLFASLFSGDIQWGVSAEIGDGAVAFRTSAQIVDPDHTVVAKAIDQFLAFGSPLSNNISMQQTVTAGEFTLNTFQDADSDLTGMHPSDIGLWAYVYTSAQRPNVRVREYIEGGDVLSAYWGFNDPFHAQSGNGPSGDLPGEFKFLYGGAVIRNVATAEGVYAIYGSSWVHLADDDPEGSRVMPPYQGAAGGPSGGPLFTVHGREVDMFFMPLGVRPGSILEVGDTFRMAGPIMPTLPSAVSYTVVSPDGREQDFDGRASAIGYYYDPDDDFTVDQPGLWTVRLAITHDGLTSAGLVEEPYPTGGILAPDGNTFTFVVTDPQTTALAIQTDLDELTAESWYCHNVQEAYFDAELPTSMEIERAHITVTTPGTVLVDEDVHLESAELRWNLDARALNELVSTFDFEFGIADTVTVTFFVEGTLDGSPAQAVGQLVTHGTRVQRAE